MTSTHEPKWYAVRLVMESVFPGNKRLEPQFEERIVLVRGDSEEDARARAQSHAKSENDRYENALGETVVVRFKELLDVQELLADAVSDLTEVYYHFLNEEELTQVKRSLAPGSADARWPTHAVDELDRPVRDASRHRRRSLKSQKA